MKVLLTVYGDETRFESSTQEEMRQAMVDWNEYDKAAREAGVLIVCDGLEGAHTATTLRTHGGRREVTDGPFIETKEQLGGVVMLDVPDLDEAIRWAERLPWSGPVEIRPVMDYEAYAQRAGASAEGAAS
ncbi:MAG TPA: YciI family protein [Solirubrobacteraceae bacterium]|jgi:hypothetical protein